MMHPTDRILKVLQPLVVEPRDKDRQDGVEVVSREDLLLAITMLASNIDELVRTKANRGLAPDKSGM